MLAASPASAIAWHVAGRTPNGKMFAAEKARVIPSAAYTDPEVAWVGLTEDEAKARGIRLFAHVGLHPDGLAPVFVDRRQDAVQAFTFARDDHD